MKKIKLALGCLVAVAVIGCSSDEPSNGTDNQYQRINLSRGEAEVANAGYGFAWNLFDKVNAENEGKNVCLSPLSANIALTMLLNGAEGETLDEIVNALGLDGMSVDEINENSRFLVSELLDRDKRCTLHVANSLWIDENYPVRNEYKSKLSEYFNATAQNTNETNFANDVNAWCSKQTKGLISDLIKPNEHYEWALLNAIYFNNVWNEDVKFKSAPRLEFNNHDGSRTSTASMQGIIPCRYSETESARHAHIAFGNGAYYMSISLPNEDASIEQCLTELKDRKAFSNAMMARLDLTMPKFEFKTEQELNNVLKSMGINKAFDRKDAQLPYISSRYTYVTIVKQGCSIKVDEKGATAAAVTIIGGDLASPGPIFVPEPMVVDRPFIFTIYEKSTGCILFMGKIEKF